MDLKWLARSEHPALIVRIEQSFQPTLEIELNVSSNAEGDLVSNVRWTLGMPFATSGSKPVSISEARQLLSVLEQAHVPIIVPFGSGLDGETTEVRYGDHWGGASYRWWGNVPRGWGALGNCVATLRRWTGPIENANASIFLDDVDVEIEPDDTP